MTPSAEPMRFRATLLLNGKTATGIEVPPDVVAGLSGGKRPPVRVTINGHTYRSTVAVMGARFLVGVSADNRAAAGVAAGDEVDVELLFDDQPREVVVPVELAHALSRDRVAREFFDQLSYSQRQRYALSVEAAKTDTTRARRVQKAVEALRAGRKNG
jgi:hypothetical protein